jgi:hypothetical protein
MKKTRSKKSRDTVPVKGAKHDIFGSGVYKNQAFTYCKKKNPIFLWFRLENRHFVHLSAVAAIAKNLDAVGDST